MPLSLAPLAFALPASTHLHAPDLVLIAAYLIAITIFGLRFRDRGNTATSRSLKTYFLAGNTIPWWAIALSVVSAETSTLTIISIPGVAFAGNFGFLQLVLGYLLGRFVVALLFLPRYFAGDMLTAYQLIDQRFGPLLHKVTAGLFLLTRAAAEGVRVFAVSIVVSIAIGTGDILSIAIITALTLLYTFEGGLAAVIWTDVVQMAIYVAGTLVALVSLGHHVPGGWSAILHAAHAAGKLQTFNFTLNLTSAYTFWAGLLGGAFLTMASHGTDQLMVQRLLAARNLRQSQLALLSSGVVIFLQFAFFLLIGAGLWTFYGPHPTTPFRTTDYIFPTFITRQMPTGIAGLLVAAILAAAMSNLSAALNSLSSTTVVDFYLRLRQPNSVPAQGCSPPPPNGSKSGSNSPVSKTLQKSTGGTPTPQTHPISDRERLLVSKLSTVLWALVLFAIALVSLHNGGHGHVVEIGLSIASVAYGSLLGVFLLGTLTRFTTQTGATLGMITGFALNLWLWQGHFPAHLGPLTVPHIAFTWYVLIGAAATFATGALASLVFRPRPRTLITAALLLLGLSFPKGICVLQAQTQTKPQTTPPTPNPQTLPAKPLTVPPTPTTDFSQISQLVNDAIAHHQLPGAVVVIGHAGEVAFHHAYGNRKLAGEPGLDGQPSPAEPMTEDTLFDMASLTKVIVTTTAIAQLYDAGKLDFDTPLDHYLPAFNPTHDPERAKVTLRLLLTHFSGEPPDISLKDPWGLAAPDKAEGIRRALTTPLATPPATKMVYSDINFILLGTVVERISGQRLDYYAAEHVFQPLRMFDTHYHGFDRACSSGDTTKQFGSAIEFHPDPPPRGWAIDCLGEGWAVPLDEHAAPTAHDDEGTPATNPDFNHLLRGTVHDPTARRMGGVAGHAGLFSDTRDMSLFAQALLDLYAGRPSKFPLKRQTLLQLTIPQQPGHTPLQVGEHYRAQLAAEARGEKSATGDPNLLAPHYPAIADQPLRGYGWDIDSGYSKPRGRILPIGSFGHTGFTGTSLWLDPQSDTFVLILANAVHPHVGPAISNLRGEVASAAALALGLYPSADAANTSPQTTQVAPQPHERFTPASYTPGAPGPASGTRVSEPTKSPTESHAVQQPSQTGLDTLESTHFAALAPFHRLALLTNQTGLDSHNRRTIDILFNDLPKTLPQSHLTTLFSPEHGIFGAQDTEHLTAETDPSTGLHVTSLYGAHDADRHPSHDQLKDLDAVLIDLQDAGLRCFTYETVVGYFLQAAATERTQYHHNLAIVVLDRPNPLGGLTVSGPISDPGTESYINFQPIPLQHGLTLGELARYTVAAQHLDANLLIVPMQNWRRDMLFPATGLPWTPPSPNLHTPTANLLYPATTMLEFTNLSVGRGSPLAFEVFGAPTSTSPWFNAETVASTLNSRHLPGVTFAAIQLPIPEDKNHYPGHGQTIPAVHILLTDPTQLNAPDLGIQLLSTLHSLYPAHFALDKAGRLLANRATLDALTQGDEPQAIVASWTPALDRFRAVRQSFLLY